ncbi:LapA family protein [Actinomycetospora endophytica]|uniref:LapA family protein n=1 Tax=Actinomycetospora endophytica TaxID=2291215 RepID=A0ABS8P8Z7_9PSEU|nr:LapA family protein [Actinomycetospora endophytica]MCD2194746.1 LapA family protein [Actinomycetospora endophytica]
MTSTPQSRTSSDPGNGWWTSRWVLGVILAVIAVVFILENRQPVEIRLLIPVVTMPLWAALTAMVVIGLLIGFLLRRR